MSTRRRILRTGAATLVQKVVRLADQLLLVPFFLAAWGAPYYGEWLTLTVVPAALALSDFGFGTAAATAFVLSYSSGQHQKAESTMKTGFRALLMVSLLVLILLGVVLVSLVEFGVFEHVSVPINDALLAIVLLMLSRTSGFFFLLFEALFRAGRRPDLGINLTTGYSLLKVLAIVGVLALGGRAPAVAAADLAATVLFVGYYILRGHRLLPHVRWWNASYLPKAETLKLVYKGFGHLGYPAWQSIYFQGTTAAVRIVVGPEGVALFNTLRTMTRTVNQIPGIVEGSFFPELQVAIGEGRNETVQRLYRVGLGGSFLGSVLGVLAMIAFGPVLFRLWTHGEFLPSSSLWVPMLLAVLINGAWSTISTIFRATNMPGRFALVGIAAATVSVASSWYLGSRFGLVGAAWGALVLEVSMALYVIPASASMIGLDLRELPSQLLRDLRRRSA